MQSLNKELCLNLLVAVTFSVMLTVNALANILPINGIHTGTVSDSFPNLFAPVGLTFSIWGLIYILLAVHTLYQLGLFRGKDNKVKDVLLTKIAVVFSTSSLINAAWIFSWHYKIIPLSMALMSCLIICLIYIAYTLSAQSLTLREILLIRLPFSVYFGWITVATIANATTLLVSIGWDGFGLPDSTWAVIMTVVGALIGAATAIRFKDAAYSFVLIWAYLGILIKHTTASGFSSQYPDVIIAVIACIILFIAIIVHTLFAAKRTHVLQ